MGGTVPARMPRGASVDGAAGRALGLTIRRKMWFKYREKKCYSPLDVDKRAYVMLFAAQCTVK